MSRIRKTEHAGAKNGGGYWGTREEAKTLSKKLRRATGKKTIQKELTVTALKNGVFRLSCGTQSVEPFEFA